MKRQDLLKQSAMALTAGFGLTLPNLNAAQTNSPSKTKYLFVLESNGLPQRQIQPNNVPFIHYNDRTKHAEYEIKDLPHALEPVADYKDQMCIIQGVSGRICGGGHSNDHGTLGSYNSRDGRNIVAPTIDYLIGQQRKSVFNNIVLGINANNKDVVFNCSAEGRGKSIATICNPLAAYNRIFGALGNPEAISKDEKIIRYLKGEIQTLSDRFGGDKKLIQYEKAFDKIIARNKEIKKTKVNKLPELSEKYHSMDHVEMLDAHFEIAGATLREGLSDVATIAVGVGYTHFQIKMDSLEGIVTPRHGLGHANMGHVHPDDPWASHDEAAIVRNYIFKLVARTMKEVDNLVVVYCSDAAEKHHSNCYEWPYVLLTNGKTNLQLDGRFIYYPKEQEKGHKTINALHNTILKDAGIHLDVFGETTKSIAREAQYGTLKELIS